MSVTLTDGGRGVMTDPPERPEYLKARGGCLWWLAWLAAMLAGCVGFAAVAESTAMHCPENHFSKVCASRIVDDLTRERPPVRPAD